MAYKVTVDIRLCAGKKPSKTGIRILMEFPRKPKKRSVDMLMAMLEIREYAEVVGHLISVKFPRTWALFVEKKL